LKVVTLTEHPHLAPAVAEWLFDEFRHALSPPYSQQVAQLLARRAPEETFVLFDDDVPAGTASLVADDLPSRPDRRGWQVCSCARSFVAADTAHVWSGM
jgi:hypothetical protein